MHSISVGVICQFDPLLSNLLKFILNLPLRLLGLTSGGDLLDIGRNHIHGWCFPMIVRRKLIRVMAWLIIVEAGYSGGVVGFSLLELRLC